jgi:hypothetical protein
MDVMLDELLQSSKPSNDIAKIGHPRKVYYNNKKLLNLKTQKISCVTDTWVWSLFLRQRPQPKNTN